MSADIVIYPISGQVWAGGELHGRVLHGADGWSAVTLDEIWHGPYKTRRQALAVLGLRA